MGVLQTTINNLDDTTMTTMTTMTSFKIETEETLSRIVEIEAPSAQEAIDKARAMYRAEQIVLDADDWVGTEIEEYEG